VRLERVNRGELTDLGTKLGKPQFGMMFVEQVDEGCIFEVVLGSSFGGGHFEDRVVADCQRIKGRL
jgi:hypothetical protein